MTTEEMQEEVDVWDVLRGEVKGELEQIRKELEEIGLMLEQSQLEVGKLAQRNASVTAHLQQVQGHFDSLPRADIRIAYDSALETQQRLFVMRGQLEKLQSDQQHLKRYAAFLERLAQLLVGNKPRETRPRVSQSMVETVEMMIEAQEAERLRLSRQMHDGPAQALSNFILQTEIALRLFDLDQAKARDELANLKTSAANAFQQVRDFIFELRPMMLDDLGLVPTIRRFVDALKPPSGMEIQLTVTGMERRFESYIEVMIFRAIQELVNNAMRHSQASEVKVQVDLGDNLIKVIVDDNGKGFDTAILDERSRMGIRLIKERVEKLGGFLEISSIPEKGTRISFQIPTAHTL